MTAVHQAAKAAVPHAPRVDVIGRRAIARPLMAMNISPPRGQALQNTALAFDLISNTAYYALLGRSEPKHLWRNAWLLGLVAGVGAVALPPVMGLGSKPVARRADTALMTIGWYTLGALATAATMKALSRYAKT